MDTAAARIINTMLGNKESAAVLELHFPAAELEFDADIAFAIGGGDFGAKLDDERIKNWSSTLALKGSTLKFTKKYAGSRAYIAVQNGLRVGEWIGSASTNLAAGVGGFSGRKLAVSALIFKGNPGHARRDSRLEGTVSHVGTANQGRRFDVVKSQAPGSPAKLRELGG